MADFDPVSYMMGAKAGSGGGRGGGSSTLSGLTDVDISNPTDGQTLVFNGTTGKWENGAGGGGAFIVQMSWDDDVATLNKTWQEIHDAALTTPVWILNIDSDTTHAVFIPQLIGQYSEDDNYFIQMYSGGDNLIFTCGDPSERPVYTESL